MSRKQRSAPLPLWRRLIRAIFHSLSRMVNLFLALLLFLALASQIISPTRLLFPAYLGIVFPLLFVGVLIFILYRLLRRQWRDLAVNVVLAMLAWPTMATYFAMHPKLTPAPEGAIKVLTLNCQAFQFEKHSNAHPNPTLAYLKESKADIICLQEAMVQRSEKKEYVTEAKIKQYLANYPYQDLRLAQESGSRLMLLSKYPIEAVERLPLSSMRNGAIRYLLKVGDKELAVYNVHLESFALTMDDGENYLKLAKEADALALRSQMDQKLGPAYRKRAQQVDRLHFHLTSEKAPYSIIMGDFNDTPISYARYRLAKGREDAFRSSGFGPGFSFHFRHMGVRIDHILHSHSISSYQCHVDKSPIVSDHRPVWCYITLND